MMRRTVLNVVEKIVSPVPGSRMMIGVTHHPFLESVPVALMDLGIEHALVYGSIEGSDETSLDGSSPLVRVRSGDTEEFRALPESVGLSRAKRSNIPWESAEDETNRSPAALKGEAGPVADLILYNAALRLWTATDEDITSLVGCVERARKALSSGAAIRLLDTLRQPIPVGG
ncbi:MAG: hypothetical protein M3122_02025 [Actinomycetota bacterium]|nr:hypothetical protein [Actinomycetota bacterium]